MKRLIFLLIAIYGISVAHAQQRIRTQLSGKITDAATGQPIAGASVILSDSRAGTVTDSNGYYVLRNIPAGHTIIEISVFGYKTTVEHLDISINNEFDFSLTPSILENEGVTITAVANATSIRNAPISITRMNRSELMAGTSSNIIDALSRQPGVNQLSTGPAISKPVIRGLGYNRLVVINDGVRQEGQQWGDEHGIEIDESSVHRIEIVKGPASLIYGSDALAGVINIITTNPLPVNTFRGSLMTGYQTNNRQRSLYGNFGGNNHGFNWNAWGSYKAAADYQNRYDGRVYNSKFNERNFGGYLGLNRSWGFSHLIFSSFNQKPGVIEGDRDVNGNFIRQLPGGLEGIPTTQDFLSTNAQVPYQRVRHQKFISDNSFKLGSGRLSLNLALQRNQRQEFGDASSPEASSLYFDLQTFSYSTAYHFNDKQEWTTTAGLNGMFQSNQNKAEEVLIPEYGFFDLGAFVYARKSWDNTTLSGGLRFDHRSLKTDAYFEGPTQKFTALKTNYSNVSASAGVSHSATENLVFKLNVARGFRAPSIPELSSNGTHEGTGRYEYGSAKLSSEKSWQADAGVEAGSQHLNVTATLFYNHINDFIYSARLLSAAGGDSLVNVNGEFTPAFQYSQNDATLTGFEVIADLHPHPLDWLHWENTFSYVRGRFDMPVEGTRNLPYIPSARWISELRGDFLRNGKVLKNVAAHFLLDHTFQQEHPFTAYGTETSTNGYTLLSAGINAGFFRKGRELFRIFLNAANLGDVAYQSHLSRLKYTASNMATGRQGVFNMGRNFSIKVNVGF